MLGGERVAKGRRYETVAGWERLMGLRRHAAAQDFHDAGLEFASFVGELHSASNDLRKPIEPWPEPPIALGRTHLPH